MKILVESPRGRQVYDDERRALWAIQRWLERQLKADVCASITVGTHLADENCDHETEATGE